jgi:hypothetical protein
MLSLNYLARTITLRWGASWSMGVPTSGSIYKGLYHIHSRVSSKG